MPEQLPRIADVEDPGFLELDPLPYLKCADTPTLIFCGDDDDVPVEASVSAIERLDSLRADVRRLPGTRHDLTTGGHEDRRVLHPGYESGLAQWTIHPQKAMKIDSYPPTNGIMGS